MRSKGVVITCDICGTFVAVRPQDPPVKGWSMLYHKDLCPSCSRAFDHILRTFNDERKRLDEENHGN